MKTPLKLSLVASLVAVVISCGSDSKPSSAVNVDDSRIKGETDAKQLLSLGDDSVKIQCQLLNVRSVEHSMRESGNNDQADAYINSFVDWIKTHNDSLAAVIFGSK